MRAQLTEGENKGAIPRAIAFLANTEKNRAFNRAATEVRIDYVQHALSAFLGYRQLLIEVDDW